MSLLNISDPSGGKEDFMVKVNGAVLTQMKNGASKVSMPERRDALLERSRSLSTLSHITGCVAVPGIFPFHLSAFTLPRPAPSTNNIIFYRESCIKPINFGDAILESQRHVTSGDLIPCIQPRLFSPFQYGILTTLNSP
jgi:hypothetical protein